MNRFMRMFLCVLLILFSSLTAFSAGVPDGYAGLKWGTTMETVKKQFPKGKVSKFHTDEAYTQENPNADIALRTFIFKDNKLIGTSVKFNAEYVMKVGLDNLLAQHKKAYGDGKLDRSQGAHMITYVWDGPQSRVTYAYAPKRADMCVVLFQQK